MENATEKKCPMCGCSKCQCLKMLIPIIVGFGFVFIYEYALHHIVLKSQYAAFESLWRTPPDMKKHMPVGAVFQFLMTALLFCVYKKGFKGCPSGALKFGVKVGILMGIAAAFPYVFLPVPASLAVCWFAGEFVKVLMLGLIFGMLCSKCCNKNACDPDDKTGGCA